MASIKDDIFISNLNLGFQIYFFYLENVYFSSLFVILKPDIS